MRGARGKPAGAAGARRDVEPRWRELVLRVPDLRDRAKNQRLADLLEGTLRKALRLMER